MRVHVGLITLVCTAHTAAGQCNEQELLRILGAVRPEVVFEEIRPGDFNKICTLETRAVRRYAETGSVTEVPVDSYTIPDSLDRDLKAMWDCVESIYEYRAVVEEMQRQKYEGGFPLMNSPAFEALSVRSTELLDWAIRISCDDDLERTLSAWKGLNDGRDEAMLNNIYEYCRKTPFARGAFLVGVGHLSSILKRVEERSKAEPSVATWKLWNRS